LIERGKRVGGHVEGAVKDGLSLTSARQNTAALARSGDGQIDEQGAGGVLGGSKLPDYKP